MKSMSIEEERGARWSILTLVKVDEANATKPFGLQATEIIGGQASVVILDLTKEQVEEIINFFKS